MHKSVIFLILLISHLGLFAQAIFDESVLHEINIVFQDSSYREELETNVRNFQARFGHIYVNANISIDGFILDSVGIRHKGKSSYFNDQVKKSFKIDFNEFIKGQKFQGLKKMNLHNSYADESMLRDPFVYNLYRKMGIHAPRTSYAKVHINDEYIGLFQIVEQIDNAFEKGVIFKNMEWDALTSNTFRESISLKSGKNDLAWDRLRKLIAVIESLEGEEFRDSLEDNLDMDQFIKVLAVYTATNNYDSVIGTGRNWYLILPKGAKRFKWIPWDNNLTFSALLPKVKDQCLIRPDFSTQVDNKKVKFFDFSGYYANVNWLWEFGDGNTSTEVNPVHTYKRKRKYDVCLTISMPGYCEEKFCKEVNVKETSVACEKAEFGQSKSLFRKTVENDPNCCAEWTSSCESYYQNLRILGERPPYDFGFYALESKSDFVQKIMEVDEFKTKYQMALCKVLAIHLDDAVVDEYINKNVNVISEAVKSDPYAMSDYSVFLELTTKNKSKINLRNIISHRRSQLLSLGNCEN